MVGGGGRREEDANGSRAISEQAGKERCEHLHHAGSIVPVLCERWPLVHVVALLPVLVEVVGPSDLTLQGRGGSGGERNGARDDSLQRRHVRVRLPLVGEFAGESLLEHGLVHTDGGNARGGDGAAPGRQRRLQRAAGQDQSQHRSKAADAFPLGAHKMGILKIQASLTAHWHDKGADW